MNELGSPFYVEKLREHLCEKQRLNPNYSIRALARDLELHGSSLNQVFRGKRSLPKQRAQDIAERLNLSPLEKSLFIESFYEVKSELDKIKVNFELEQLLIDESNYKIIAEWEHYAVLTLLKIENINLTLKLISEKLSLSDARSNQVVDNLIKCQLIKKNEEGFFIRLCPTLRTTNDISSDALKKSHKETLEMGLRKIDELNVELRDFSSVMVGTDMDKLDDAKAIIREFRKKMLALFEGSNKQEVFQLAIQFYPVSNVKSRTIQ